jgi:hypothetical protein
MFNHVVLDVVTGLIFVFLMYSLLATILQEIIARWLNLRGRMLQKALRRMLEDDAGQAETRGLSTLKTETQNMVTRFFHPFKGTTLLERFYRHPTIKYLGEDKIFSKPSYLHSHNFSQTIVHLLRGEEYDGRTSSESEHVWNTLKENRLNINNETLINLKNLFADARQDIQLFKLKVEDWFEETMERATGWYKKQTQTILLLIGLAMAILFNVDAIAIARILMKDKKAREQLVQMAISHQQTFGAAIDSMQKVKVTKTEIRNGDTTVTSFDSTIKSPVTDKFLESTYNELSKSAAEAMGVMGLRGIPKRSDTTGCRQSVSNYDTLIKYARTEQQKTEYRKSQEAEIKKCLKEKRMKPPYQNSVKLKLLGWLLTALAVSLGAPFWFDLLNKFIRLRESGPRPVNTSALDKPAGTAATGTLFKGADGKEITG